MILSVSRRTDIPAFYSEWFMNRIKKGYVLVRNPMNYKQISKINISPQLIECIVFWTKNAIPMMKYLDELEKRGYVYIFQYTITPYNNNVEKYILDKKYILNNVKILSNLIGKNRIIWRYDPILINDEYSLEKHVYCFDRMCKALSGFVNHVVISFIDKYSKIKKANIKFLSIEDIYYISYMFGQIAKKYNISIKTCCEKYDLAKWGISHGACIDKDLLETVLGYSLNIKKATGQRPYCLCSESIDIGSYNTCRNGCIYCYATNETMMKNKIEFYDKNGEMLCDTVTSKDIIKERYIKILREKEEL